MIGMEIVGVGLGFISRLTQSWMETRDRQREREHEAVMFEKQIRLNDQKFLAEASLRQMDYQAQQDAGELDALVTAIKSQAGEARAAGGWVAKLSASVRPVISYWLLIIYSAAKAAALYLTIKSGVPLGDAIVAAYTNFDGALLGSIMSFWFADRSLRKAGR